MNARAMTITMLAMSLSASLAAQAAQVPAQAPVTPPSSKAPAIRVPDALVNPAMPDEAPESAPVAEAPAQPFDPAAYRAAVQRANAAVNAQDWPNAAKQLEDLSPEQREGIETIERDYLSQLAGMNDRLRDLYRTEEPNEPRRRFERVMRRQRGEAPSREAVGEPESIRDLRGERENVGRLAREAILALLTPDQVSRLPGFSKPEGEPAKDAFGGFQQTPQSNDAQGLGSDSTMTDEERRRQAPSPKDRSPPPAIGGRGSKQADSERIRSDSPRGRGSRPDSGQSPPPLQAE